ncbi:hypothetical protein HJFPF1_00673 [Paramyrothecium foliicola]|nr:hypothetical protein HJFPF1_00673 [Paramyrothecium foliicola]
MVIVRSSGRTIGNSVQSPFSILEASDMHEEKTLFWPGTLVDTYYETYTPADLVPARGLCMCVSNTRWSEGICDT